MPEERWLPIVQDDAIAAMMPMIRADLAALNIQHDVFFSEASLSQGGTDKVKAAIEELRPKGYIYQGRLAEAQGHESDEWEDREQTLFQIHGFRRRHRPGAAEVGRQLHLFCRRHGLSLRQNEPRLSPPRQRLRRRSHGLHQPDAGDRRRLHRRHRPLKSKGKLKDWRTAGGTADLDIRVVNLVKLFKNGEPFKMSKRAGTFVTLRDVVDEVGPDAVRFMMLYRKELEPLDFDFQKVTEQSRDNPVFYVQYGHARCCSVFRKANEAFPGLTPASAEVSGAELSRLDHPGEIDLMRRLAEFPRVVEGAAQAHEPHRIAFYLYELASDLHGLWNQGKDLPQLRFIREDDRELTAARVALVSATANVLATGLRMLGVHAPEEMR